MRSKRESNQHMRAISLSSSFLNEAQRKHAVDKTQKTCKNRTNKIKYHLSTMQQIHCTIGS